MPKRRKAVPFAIGHVLNEQPREGFFSQGQVIYSAITGYLMIQGPGSAPVAIPTQRGSDMAAVQNVPPCAQGGQPQMV